MFVYRAAGRQSCQQRASERAAGTRSTEAPAACRTPAVYIGCAKTGRCCWDRRAGAGERVPWTRASPAKNSSCANSVCRDEDCVELRGHRSGSARAATVRSRTGQLLGVTARRGGRGSVSCGHSTKHGSPGHRGHRGHTGSG